MPEVNTMILVTLSAIHVRTLKHKLQAGAVLWRSPCLKLKPVSASTKSGFQMVNVEPYGGGLWHTWFDRDLSVAGRVLLRDGDRLVHRLARSPQLYP